MPYVVFPSYFGSAAEMAAGSFPPPWAHASLMRSIFCTSRRQLESGGVTAPPTATDGAGEETPPPAPALAGPCESPARAPFGGGLPGRVGCTGSPARGEDGAC